MSTNVNLVVATPCFGGQISVTYAGSIFKLQKVLRSAGEIDLKVIFKDGDALITRARASLVAQFLDDPTATHLLFVDADIGFEPDQVMRLINCGAEVCAAVYPIKRIDWSKVKSVMQAERPNPGAAALHYVFEVSDPNAVAIRAAMPGPASSWSAGRRWRRCARTLRTSNTSAITRWKPLPPATIAMRCSTA
jgi:hypothetical protein